MNEVYLVYLSRYGENVVCATAEKAYEICKDEVESFDFLGDEEEAQEKKEKALRELKEDYETYHENFGVEEICYCIKEIVIK